MPTAQRAVCLAITLTFIPLLSGKVDAASPFQLPRTPRGQYPVVSTVSLQPNGGLIAAAGDTHIVFLMDRETGETVRELKGHTDWVRSVQFSRDGRLLATGGNDRRLVVWDTTSWQPIFTAVHQQAVIAVSFSHNGGLLAVAGFQNAMKVYSATNWQVVMDLACPCQDMRVVTFSPDDRLLAAGGRNGKVRIWNVETGRFEPDIRAHRQRIRGLAFSPSGNRLVTAGEDRVVQIWDVASRTEQTTLPSRPTKTMAIVFCGSGRLVTAGSDNLVRRWDLDSGRELSPLDGHRGTVTTLDSDGSVIVSGSFDTTIRVWRW